MFDGSRGLLVVKLLRSLPICESRILVNHSRTNISRCLASGHFVVETESEIDRSNSSDEFLN